MFNILPVELLERIFLCLSISDIPSVFSAFNKQFSVLPNYFWKTVCQREDFIRAYKSQEWHECFQCGINKKFGNYDHQVVKPHGTLEHVYLKALITSNRNTNTKKSTYNVFVLDSKNNLNFTQHLSGDVQFKEEFIIIHKKYCVAILRYNCVSNRYEYYSSLLLNDDGIFGLTCKYCTTYDQKLKVFNLYELHGGRMQREQLPADVKFLIEKILHKENIVISTLSYNDGYKIKVYEIKSNSWTLDLTCFASTGITNDPNVWVGSNFIGCCDVSYRLRGIYFGPFKVWDKKGKMLLQADIEPSNKHYLHCFFANEHIILTTSDNTITTYNNLGKHLSKFHTSTSFLDIKLSSGRLLFLLLEYKDSIEVYDWSLCCYIYSINLSRQCSKSLCSDFLYCPIQSDDNNFEIVNFFFNT